MSLSPVPVIICMSLSPVPVIICMSFSRTGYHLYVFFPVPVIICILCFTFPLGAMGRIRLILLALPTFITFNGVLWNILDDLR